MCLKNSDFYFSGNLGKAQLLVRDYRGVTYQVDPNNGQANTILNVQPSNLKNITYLEFSTFQYIYYTKEDARTIMRYNVSSGNSSFYYNLSKEEFMTNTNNTNMTIMTVYSSDSN